MSAPTEVGSRRTLLALVLVAGGAALWIAWMAAWGPDWPAQDFRAWLARHVGLTVWSNAWYGGDALVSYSVLYPVLAVGLGAAFTGVLAVAATSAGAAGFAARGPRWLAIAFHLSVTVVLLAELLIGEVPFLAGVAFGTWALRALVSRRGFVALLLAAACSLTSPIAGAFLLVCLPALAVAISWRAVVPLLAAVLGPATALVFGGVGGNFPFASATLAEVSVFCIALLIVSRKPAVDVFALTYFVVCVVSYAVPNPVGGDVARLGELVALPLVWHLIPTTRAMSSRWVGVVALLAAVAAAWQIYPAASAAARGASDPSQHPQYYAGLLSFLHRHDAGDRRVEVVFTREHWEAYWVAREVPIARGWERQTDLRVADVLYHRSLTAASYYRWLRRNAVSFVALPDVPIDYGGRAEATLLQHPPTYLRLVYTDAHWRVWKVVGTRPLVSGPARMLSWGTASITLDFRRAGTATIRTHGSDLWQVAHGAACVRTDRAGWLAVNAQRPGRVAVRARLSLDAVTGTSPSACPRVASRGVATGSRSAR